MDCRPKNIRSPKAASDETATSPPTSNGKSRAPILTTPNPSPLVPTSWASTTHLLPQPHTISHRLYISKIDRKSRRLNSSHVAISYAVFCLTKKKSRKENRGH